MREPIYRITFDNGNKFKGGTNYFKTGWTTIPDENKIKTIFYRLPNRGYLRLEGYDKYFHMIEATMNLTGKKKGKPKIRYVYIMGEKDNIVTCYKIKLIDRPTEEIINIQTYNKNDEFIRKLNPLGWKLGGI